MYNGTGRLGLKYQLPGNKVVSPTSRVLSFNFYNEKIKLINTYGKKVIIQILVEKTISQ